MKIKFEVNKNGRVATLKTHEKKCKFCGQDEGELYFNENQKCLVCESSSCQSFCIGSDIQSMNYKVDKWIIQDDDKTNKP
jgi:hypothetical protein